MKTFRAASFVLFAFALSACPAKKTSKTVVGPSLEEQLQGYWELEKGDTSLPYRLRFTSRRLDILTMLIVHFCGVDNGASDGSASYSLEGMKIKYQYISIIDAQLKIEHKPMEIDVKKIDAHVMELQNGATYRRFTPNQELSTLGNGDNKLCNRELSKKGRMTSIVVKSKDTANYCPEVNEGQTCMATWQQAMDYCQSQGFHLPTAREYARVVAFLGTKILEPSDVKGDPPKGYYLVDSRNPDGSLDRFYMNHSEFKPLPEMTKARLWTSSIPPQHPQFAHVLYMEWGGGGGDPKEHKLDYRNAFQCVQ
ncbi:MAG: hypothetical protein AB7F86_16980 [Bdellovibrionales bacterium]